MGLVRRVYVCNETTRGGSRPIAVSVLDVEMGLAIMKLVDVFK